MTHADPTAQQAPPCNGPKVVECADLDSAIALYTQQRGFRLDMIMPADAPRVALVSNNGITVRLQARDASETSETTPAISSGMAIAGASDNDGWVQGRAGMLYRDLIPGRLGGRIVASQIRIPDGGPVPDYVHFHKIGFQMIYCRRGWVRVVYEDQGPAFVMHAGDCVLQPPMIRHRVLESSAGLEVIEIGCPAVHETWRDHDMALPTPELVRERVFAGQRFVHHLAVTAQWQRREDARFEFRDTGISAATCGLARVRVLRALPNGDPRITISSAHTCDRDVVFLFVLEGDLQLASATFGTHTLKIDDACAIPAGASYTLNAVAPCELLEVAMSFASS